MPANSIRLPFGAAQALLGHLGPQRSSPIHSGTTRIAMPVPLPLPRPARLALIGSASRSCHQPLTYLLNNTNATSLRLSGEQRTKHEAARSTKHEARNTEHEARSTETNPQTSTMVIRLCPLCYMSVACRSLIQLASARPSIVEDSNGDDDSDYSYETDLIRHRARRATFKIELDNHSRKMAARRPKRKRLAPSRQTSSLSSSVSLHESSEDDSEDDILAFLQPKQQQSLGSLLTAAPKLTMADIRERVTKNKARDKEIRRAQRLLEESESLNQRPTQPSNANINSYLESQEGAPALLSMLKPSGGKSDQLPRWSFFGGTVAPQRIPLEELCASIRASACISGFLGSDVYRLGNQNYSRPRSRIVKLTPQGVEDIRDLLVSGTLVDYLRVNLSRLELSLRHLLLDAGISRKPIFFLRDLTPQNSLPWR